MAPTDKSAKANTITRAKAIMRFIIYLQYHYSFIITERNDFVNKLTVDLIKAAQVKIQHQTIKTKGRDVKLIV